MAVTTLSPTTREKAYQIACTGAVDNEGGSGVNTYVIYAEQFTGSPADPRSGNFENAIEIGRLTNLSRMPCYYKDSSKPNWNELKLRQADGTPITTGVLPKYGPDNVYMYNWRTWIPGYRYRIWILSIDQFGNEEALNDSSLNSPNYALFATDSLTAAELAFTSTPTLSVAEGDTGGENAVAIDANGNEYSIAELTLGELYESVGTLSRIKVDYKQASKSSWRLLTDVQHDPSLDNMSESGAYITERLILDTRPATYDFRATFFNYNNVPAEDGVGDLLQVEATSIVFDGVSKYEEFIGCKNVTCENHTNDVLPNDIAELVWDAPTEAAGPFDGAFGVSRSPNDTELKKLRYYIVMMYIPTDGQDAQYQRPGLNDGETENGSWYYMGRFEGESARVQCPRGLSVGFWVGFATEDIDSALTLTPYTGS